MQPRLDPLGKVAELYKDGSRQVPYLTFMHIFNNLLEDPMAVVAKQPCEELKDTFRAACMAVSIGVSDPEGRAPQRLREFQAKVLSVWKEKLSPNEFRQFEDVIRGGGLRRRRALRNKETTQPIVAANEKSSALLKRLQLASPERSGKEPAQATPKPWREPHGEGGPEITPAAVQPAPPAGAVQTDDNPPTEALEAEHVPTFESMSDLCRALHDGQVRAELGQATSREFARYRLSGQEVSCRQALAGRQTYVVLTVSVGYGLLAGGLEAMDVMAGAMGYARMTAGAYVRKDDDYVQTLKAAPRSTNLASTAAGKGVQPDLQTQLTRLQWDLGELLERMDVR